MNQMKSMEEQLRSLNPRHPSSEIRAGLFGEIVVAEEAVGWHRLLCCLAPAAACVVAAFGALHSTSSSGHFSSAGSSTPLFASVSNTVLEPSDGEFVVPGTVGSLERNVWSTVICRSTNEQRWEISSGYSPGIGTNLVQ